MKKNIPPDIEDPAIKHLMHRWSSNNNHAIGAKLSKTSKYMGNIDLRMEGSPLQAPPPLLTQYRIGRNAIIAGIRQQLQETLAASLAANEDSSDNLATRIKGDYRNNPMFQINYEDDPVEKESGRLEDWLAFFGLKTRGNELEQLLYNTSGDAHRVAAALDDYLVQNDIHETDVAALELIQKNYYKAILLTLQEQNLPNMPELIPDLEAAAATLGGKRTLKRKKRRTKKNRRSKSRRHLTKNKKRKTKRR